MAFGQNMYTAGGYGWLDIVMHAAGYVAESPTNLLGLAKLINRCNRLLVISYGLRVTLTDNKIMYSH